MFKREKYCSSIPFPLLKAAPRWCSGRASDSESRGPGLDPHMRHRVVSLSKALKY